MSKHGAVQYLISVISFENRVKWIHARYPESGIVEHQFAAYDYLRRRPINQIVYIAYKTLKGNKLAKFFKVLAEKKSESYLG